MHTKRRQQHQQQPYVCDHNIMWSEDDGNKKKIVLQTVLLHI